MRVLVSGGAGFAGAHVVEALRARGHEPVVLDVRADPAADVRHELPLARALDGVDAVCHQAAVVGLGAGFADAVEYVSRNDLGTAVLPTAMAGRGVRELVPAGSMVVHGARRYTCARHGAVWPGPRLVGDLTACDTGSGEPHTVSETAAAPVHGGPEPGVTGEYRPGDVRHVTADSSRLRSELGWKPQLGFTQDMREFASAGTSGA